MAFKHANAALSSKQGMIVIAQWRLTSANYSENV